MTSCMSKRELIDYKDVAGIKFWYLPKDMRTLRSIQDCGDVVRLKEDNKDTIITDEATIKEYISAVNELKPARRHKDRYDLRVTSLIKFKTKEKKIGVCVSRWDGKALVDGVLMKENERMATVVDKMLYDHLPPDAWVRDILRDK